MEDIQYKIDNMSSIGKITVEEIIDLVNEVENEEDKRNLFNQFIIKIMEILAESNLDEDTIRSNIKFVTNIMKDSGMDIGLFTSVIFDNNFTYEGVLDLQSDSKDDSDVLDDISDGDDDTDEVSDDLTSDKEIYVIDRMIVNLEQQLGITDNTNILEEIDRLEIEKSNKLKEINEEIHECELEISLDNNSSDNSLSDELENLEEEKNNIMVKIGTNNVSDDDKERFDELNILIEDIKEKIKNNKNGVLNELEDELKQLQDERETLYIKSTLNRASQEEDERLKKLDKLIVELEEKIKNYNGKNVSSDLEKKLEELNKEYKKIQSNYDRSVENLKKLDNLKTIKMAYITIYDDAICKFEGKKLKDELLDKISNFVDSHRDVSELNKYHNSNCLKKELKNDICNNLKRKKIDKKEKNKKALLKGLSAVAGFAIGMGLSTVPGVGTIRMGIATAKLASTAINLWTKKHPDGKIAKIKNTVNEKLENKFPRITEKIKLIKEKLNNPTFKWFVNGVAAGYVAGNVIELVTGQTVFEHLRPRSIDSTPDVPTSDASVPETNDPVIDTPDADVAKPINKVPDIDPSSVKDISDAITLNEGDVVDLSSISKGLVSSDSTKLVDIMEDVGKEVVFDKSVTLPDGRVMWHFKQLNGMGYAWFDSETVKEVLGKTVEVSTKIRG